MKCAEAEHAPQSTFAAPVATWRNGKLAGDVVFVVVDVQTQRPVNVLDWEDISGGNTLGKMGGRLTSSTSSPSPDSPRTIPSGVPII